MSRVYNPIDVCWYLLEMIKNSIKPANACIYWLYRFSTDSAGVKADEQLKPKTVGEKYLLCTAQSSGIIQIGSNLRIPTLYSN